MLREQIKKDIEKAVKLLTVNGSQLTEEKIEVLRTADPRFGDFATNVAMRVSPKVKQSPVEFAKVLADSLGNQPYVEKLEVAGGGFLNFFIKQEVWQEEVEKVLKADDKYGSNTLGKSKKARIEFVSANPTGPLHFGNARGGPIGDSLALVLQFCAYKTIREYYHNDIGVQVEKLGESILNVSKGQKLEDQEYKGEYIRELAKQLTTDNLQLTSEEAGEKAVAILKEEILKDCKEMGIEFDEIYPESEFAASGQTKQDIDHLREKGVLKEKDGALWFAPSDEFLKDRETVLVKSDGSFTYFANDIAYHDLKFKDKADLVIDIFGANHHGHVPRLQAVISALSHDVLRFHVILYQWVRFRKGKDILKMSKRSGTFVTTREVLDEVGRDALRFFILMHDPNSHIDFDLELAKKESQENPVFYVQYAHARICSILAKAGPAARHPRPMSSPALAALISEKSISAFAREELTREGLAAGTRRGSPTRVTRYELLSTNYELHLIKQITRLPELVEDIAGNFAVHRLTAYATELADSFHRFYENCRVIPSFAEATDGKGEEEDLTRARLALVMATKIALANTLKLLGISAPEKM